ncbi:alpha/beta fold hydrolase [Pseudomonadota bacterium]
MDISFDMTGKEKRFDWNQLIRRIRHPIPETLTNFTNGTIGDPIVLLHGLGASSYSWRYLTPVLGEDYQTIEFDLLGFGSSPKPGNTTYSIYDQAALVINYIKEQGLNNVSLVGHSFGGGVALVIAAYFETTAPGLVKKLVLIGSIGCRQEPPWFIRLLRIPLIPRILGYFVPPSFNAKTMLKVAFFDRSKITLEMVRAYAKPGHEAAARSAIIETAKQIQPDDLDKLIEKYNDIDVPTLLIWGRQDRIVPMKIGEELHTLLSNSNLHIVDNCGHLPHEEKPELVIPLIHAFLNQP